MSRPAKSSLVIALLAATWMMEAAAQTPGTTLKDFFTSALNYSPAIKAAEEQWHATDARTSYATGQLLPQVNASASLSKNSAEEQNVKRDYDGRNYAVQLSQVLFNWQAFTARQQASLQENQQESLYYAQVALTLTVVADNYLTVLQSEDTLTSINSELDAMNNQVKQIEQLYNLQLAKITDLYQGQAQQAALLSQQIGAQSDLNVSRESLRATTGLEIGGLKRLPAAITTEPLTGTLDDWLAKAKANNKQIAAGEFALKAADKAVSMRVGSYFPRVTLVVARQQSDVGYNNLPLQQSTNTNYIGVDFSIPLFAGGSNRALVREARSQRNIAEAQLQQTTLDVQDRVRTAYYKVTAGQARIEAGRKLAEATATSYTAMKRGFELGTVTSVDVLNALRDQFKAQRDLQQARYDYIRYSLVLLREAGTLTPMDLEHVSEQLNAPAINL